MAHALINCGGIGQASTGPFITMRLGFAPLRAAEIASPPMSTARSKVQGDRMSERKMLSFRTSAPNRKCHTDRWGVAEQGLHGGERQPEGERMELGLRPGFNLDFWMRGAQRVDALDDLRRQAFGLVVNEYPLRHAIAPMGARAVEVLVDLGDQLGVRHGLWSIALESRLCTDATAVAFEIALSAIRASSAGRNLHSE
jgi:hypothetical protein